MSVECVTTAERDAAYGAGLVGGVCDTLSLFSSKRHHSQDFTSSVFTTNLYWSTGREAYQSATGGVETTHAKL